MLLLSAVKLKKKKKILGICVFSIHDRTLVAQSLGYQLIYPRSISPVNLFPFVLFSEPFHSKNNQNVTSHYSSNKK